MIGDLLTGIVGAANIDLGCDVKEEDTHDEALGGIAGAAAGRGASGLDRRGGRHGQGGGAERDPSHPTGSGTGLSGGCIPSADGGSWSRSNG